MTLHELMALDGDLLSQLYPVNLTGQMHLKLEPSSTHCPPLRQGLEAHGPVDAENYLFLIIRQPM